VNWQTIETAPKDVAILVWDEWEKGMGVAQWVHEWESWCWAQAAASDEYPANGPIRPTHWMPLPEPPK
jgi:hypothetical protein